VTELTTAAPRPRRLRRVLWRAGWVLLAVASFCVAYALLVTGGH
jgi:hypothetical protein